MIPFWASKSFYALPEVNLCQTLLLNGLQLFNFIHVSCFSPWWYAEKLNLLKLNILWRHFFAIFWDKISEFDNTGDTSYHFVTYFEEPLRCFISNLFCGCFVSTNGSFLVKKMGIRTPGAVLCMVIPYCLGIRFEEMLSCCVVNVIMWLLSIIKWYKFETQQ